MSVLEPFPAFSMAPRTVRPVARERARAHLSPYARLGLALLLAGQLACGRGFVGTDDDAAPGAGPGGGDASGGTAVGGDGGAGGVAGELLVCPGAAFTTIGAAIAAAPAGSSIAICPGTYSEALDLGGKPLALRGLEGAATTIVDAGGAGSVVVVHGVGDPGLTLTGLTLRGGRAAAGGGVSCDASTLTLRDVVLTGNTADAGGGLHANGCAVTIDGTRFEDNAGGERGGGALLLASTGAITGGAFARNTAVTGAGVQITEGTVALLGAELSANVAALRGGGAYIEADVLVADNVIADNVAGWTGGGVYVWTHAPTVRANVVRGNRSENDGGGFYLHESRATLVENTVTGNVSGDDGGGIRGFTSELVIERNVIDGNQSGNDGGGIKVSHMPALIVDNTITNNVAVGRGGGIEQDNDASVVRGGVISGNRAYRGGGIHVALSPWLGGTIEDVEITDNQADRGGGLDVEDNFQPVVIRRVTVARNTADRGAGLYARGTNLKVSHALFVGNVSAARGGGVFVRARTRDAGPCPCPPDPAVTELAFVVIHDNQAPEGAGLYTDSPNLIVTSSVLAGNRGGDSVTVVGAAPALDRPVTPTWTYNDTTPATFTGMAVPTGRDGNLDVDPSFMDATTANFQLGSESPCRNAGDPALTDADGTRADMGAFGGTR